MNVIGLTGVAGSGKDTAAQVLIALGYTRVAFADPLREMLYALNPIITIDDTYEGDPELRVREIVDQVGWDGAKRHYSEIRELLQRLGTEAGRNILGGNIWIDVAARRATKIEGPIVFTDVRFDNEADAIYSLGGKVVEIVRPGYGPVNGHASDAGVSREFIDFTIENNATIDDLHRKVEDLAISLEEGTNE